MTPGEAAMLAITELKSATLKNGTFNSYHEGYAVILEELDELWEEVKKNPRTRSVSRMRNEAVQVAAMALRFLVDLCGEEVAHKRLLSRDINQEAKEVGKSASRIRESLEGVAYGGSISVPGAAGVPGAQPTVPHQTPAPPGHEDDDGRSS
ncbi:hypothetical protein LCGC14_1967880 [marine sediment metagenome]|uniref:Uncharacterized protein n=1 Tax=marine sediment metagenome TaxID=412755 RepID=A0A0F9FCM0_9ZZZZ